MSIQLTATGEDNFTRRLMLNLVYLGSENANATIEVQPQAQYLIFFDTKFLYSRMYEGY